MANYYRAGWLDPTAHPLVGGRLPDATDRPQGHNNAAIYHATNGHATYQRVLVYSFSSIPLQDTIELAARQITPDDATVMTFYPGYGTINRTCMVRGHYCVDGRSQRRPPVEAYRLITPTGLRA